MGELLPFFVGCLIGVATGRLGTNARTIFPLACVAAGALASALNGELHGPLWGVFVSVDSALVWLGAVVTTGLAWSWHRLSTGT